MGKKRDIFTKEDLAKLKRAERQINEILPILDDAEACGVECDPLRAVVASAQEKLAAIQQKFMTPAPTK